MQEPFPFQQLPADLQRLTAQQPGVFRRLAPLSSQTRQLVYNPQVLRVKCNLPIDHNEIQAVAPLYFTNNVYLRALSPPTTGSLRELLENPVILEASILKTPPKSFEERIAPLALNLETGKFFESTERAVYQPKLEDAIQALITYNLTQLPAKYLFNRSLKRLFNRQYFIEINNSYTLCEHLQIILKKRCQS